MRMADGLPGRVTEVDAEVEPVRLMALSENSFNSHASGKTASRSSASNAKKSGS